MQSPPLRVRGFSHNDAKLIFPAWLNSFEPFRDQRATRATYYAEQHERIERRLAHPAAVVLVACTPDDPEHILGWLVGRDDGTLDYVCVKAIYRRMGIARRLLHDFGEVKRYTHHTDAVSYLMPKTAVYNPWR